MPQTRKLLPSPEPTLMRCQNLLCSLQPSVLSSTTPGEPSATPAHLCPVQVQSSCGALNRIELQQGNPVGTQKTLKCNTELRAWLSVFTCSWTKLVQVALSNFV